MRNRLENIGRNFDMVNEERKIFKKE